MLLDNNNNNNFTCNSKTLIDLLHKETPRLLINNKMEYRDVNETTTSYRLKFERETLFVICFF